jgi:uncharacterized membrane protein
MSEKVDRLEKFKSITTEVFALTLGLGAFSLSSIPRMNLNDVVVAIGAFAIAFFYIAVIWMTHSRFFEDYPLYDEVFLMLNFVILFLVAISPYMVQIMFTSPELQNSTSILYSFDMVGVYMILGYFHQRYLQQNEDLHSEKRHQVKLNRNIQLITVVWFLISIMVPVRYRFIFWWLMAPIIPIYRIFIAPLHIKLE